MRTASSRRVHPPEKQCEASAKVHRAAGPEAVEHPITSPHVRQQAPSPPALLPETSGLVAATSRQPPGTGGPPARGAPRHKRTYPPRASPHPDRTYPATRSAPLRTRPGDAAATAGPRSTMRAARGRPSTPRRRTTTGTPRTRPRVRPLPAPRGAPAAARRSPPRRPPPSRLPGAISSWPVPSSSCAPTPTARPAAARSPGKHSSRRPPPSTTMLATPRP
mmetsp:Transcript_114165/g.329790  ORF Transcript_114165/g.329790 Transcript_114165/m.329790 type:complete len:220 (-) Transcript_114165:214-873(-)